MTTRQKLANRCTELGVTLSIDDITVSIDLPRGKVTASHELHYQDEQISSDCGFTVAVCCRRLLVDLSMGLTDCDIADCEICHE